MNETLPELPPLPALSPWLIPGAVALAIALLALAMPRLHPALPEKKSRLGGFTWWLFVALCLGGLGACAEMWLSGAAIPPVYLFWSCIFGMGAVGMWASAHTKGEYTTSAPAGMKSIGRFLDGKGRR